MKNIIKCLLFCTFAFTQYYNLNIIPTGQSHLVVLQESISGIGNGWEIGVFDTNGILNDGNCYTEYGDILVASGVWMGNQLDFSAVGSIDFCDIGGEQRAGFIENNEIVIRIFDPQNQIEYSTFFSTFDGQNAYFVSSLFTAISEISIDQELTTNSFHNAIEVNDFSITKLYPNPANPIIQIEYEAKLNQNLTFAIFGLDGKLYKKFYNNNFYGKNSLSFSLENIPSGFYYFKVGNEVHQVYKKFMVLK